MAAEVGVRIRRARDERDGEAPCGYRRCGRKRRRKRKRDEKRKKREKIGEKDWVIPTSVSFWIGRW